MVSVYLAVVASGNWDPGCSQRSVSHALSLAIANKLERSVAQNVSGPNGVAWNVVLPVCTLGQSV